MTGTNADSLYASWANAKKAHEAAKAAKDNEQADLALEQAAEYAGKLIAWMIVGYALPIWTLQDAREFDEWCGFPSRYFPTVALALAS